MTYKAILFHSRKTATFPVYMSDDLARFRSFNLPIHEMPSLAVHELSAADLLKPSYETFSPCCDWAFKNGLWFLTGLMDKDCKDNFHPKVFTGKEFYGFIEDESVKPSVIHIKPVAKVTDWQAIQFKEDKSNRQEIANFLNDNGLEWKYVDGYFFYLNKTDEYEGVAVHPSYFLVKKTQEGATSYFSVDPYEMARNWRKDSSND